MTQKTRLLAALTGLLAFSGFLGLASVAPAPAQSAPQTQIAFPMIGVGAKQSLRVNVISFPPNPCTIAIAAFSAHGVLVAFEEGSPDKPLIVGSPVEDVPLRAEIRPQVTLAPPPGSTVACHAQATAEVFNDDTKNTTVITAGLIPPGPRQIPPGPNVFGPIGFGFEQTVRLNVVAYPPNPCFGVLSFMETQGNAVGGVSQVMLGAGQATFLDLPGQTVVPRWRAHGEVMAVFTPTAGAAQGACIPSVEVFDQRTGYTRVLISPGPTTVPPGPPV